MHPVMISQKRKIQNHMFNITPIYMYKKKKNGQRKCTKILQMFTSG